MLIVGLKKLETVSNCLVIIVTKQLLISFNSVKAVITVSLTA